MVDYEGIAFVIVMGSIMGALCVFIYNFFKKRNMGKEAYKQFGIKEEDNETQQNLKECLICKKLSEGEVCSVECQEVWIKNNRPDLLNNTQLSEELDHSNKAEENSQVGANPPTSAPPKKEDESRG